MTYFIPLALALVKPHAAGLQCASISLQGFSSLAGANSSSWFKVFCRLTQYTFKMCIQVVDENREGKVGSTES